MTLDGINVRIPLSEIEHEEYTDARYKAQPFSGTAYELCDGVVSEECEFVLGRLHGQRKEFYPDGSLRWIARYCNGREHGLEEDFYRDGKVRRTATYENGVLLQEQEFAESGTTTLDYERQSAVKREWRLDGSLRKETIYGRDLAPALREVEEERYFDHEGKLTIVHKLGQWVMPSSRPVA